MDLKYEVRWDEDALYDLKKLDKVVAIHIVKKVDHYLSKAPDKLGKPLSGNLQGLYRYRLGDYRIIYQIDKLEVSIIIVKIGHRKDVYVK